MSERPAAWHAATGATVDIVVPVYNEGRELEASVRRLRRFLDDSFPFEADVTIADNASTDDTWDVACRLERGLAGVRALHLDRKGRGRALRTAWSASRSDIVAYMDVDLSTDLGALLPLVAPLASGHSDIAIGSRLASGARVIRGAKRELISRAYNLLLHLLLRNHFSDAQCGFKALRADAASSILRLVEDNEWFFDTELLVLAERNGLRVHEVPVDWSDDPDSRVRIADTAVKDLRGVGRLLLTFARGGGMLALPHGSTRETGSGPGAERAEAGDAEAGDAEAAAAELARYTSVGVVALLAYLGMFLLLRPDLNLYLANLAGSGVAALASLAARRRRVRGGSIRRWRWAAAAGSILSCSVSVVFSTLLLAAAVELTSGSLTGEIAGILAGSAIGGIVRFSVLRSFELRVHIRRLELGPPRTTTFAGGSAPFPALQGGSR